MAKHDPYVRSCPVSVPVPVPNPNNLYDIISFRGGVFFSLSFAACAKN